MRGTALEHGDLLGVLEMEERDWYVNYGRFVDGWRRWKDALQYGFLCAGNGPQYTDGLRSIPVGHRVWAYLPRNEVPDRPYGYGGVGCVRGKAVRAADFLLPDGRTLLNVLGRYANDTRHFDDPDLAEWFLPVTWLDTVKEEHLFWDTGFYAVETIAVLNSGTQMWRDTLARLRERFPKWRQCPPSKENFMTVEEAIEALKKLDQKKSFGIDGGATGGKETRVKIYEDESGVWVKKDPTQQQQDPNTMGSPQM
jgi:hypothetical protein